MPLDAVGAASVTEEETLAGGGSTGVTWLGETVRRPVRSGTPAVHDLLRHPGAKGFRDTLGQVLLVETVGVLVGGALPG